MKNTKCEQQKSEPQKVSNFETAIRETGFGKFNILLLIAVSTISFSQVFETDSMSFVAPIAQCDLNLSLKDKGILNSIVHLGMISTGFIWGHMSDLFGRRIIIVYGILLEAVFTFIGGMSQNFTMLLIAKFFSGSIMCGPFSAAASILTEFNASQYRSKMQLARGISVSLGSLLLPLIAWVILPRDINFNVFGYLHLHSWNMFLTLCCLLPLTGCIVFYFMPESPTFLMSIGKNEEALQVIRKVYNINTGKPEDTFPIKQFPGKIPNNEEPSDIPRRSSLYVAVNRGLRNLKSLFVMPYILQLFIACSNGTLLLMGSNTFKYWLPQLMQAVSDYQSSNNDASSNTCAMIEGLTSKQSSSSYVNCTVNFDNGLVYQSSLIVGVSRVLALVLVSLIVNILGKKTILVILVTISGSCAILIYFAQNVATLIALFAVAISTAQTSSVISLTMTLEIFPTTCRTTALSLYLTFGRLGSIIGNTVFPLLITTGCLPPFLFLSVIFLSAAGLTLLQPNTENKALK